MCDERWSSPKGKGHSGIGGKKPKKNLEGRTGYFDPALLKRKSGDQPLTPAGRRAGEGALLWAEDSSAPQDAWPPLLRCTLHQIAHKVSLYIAYRETMC